MERSVQSLCQILGGRIENKGKCPTKWESGVTEKGKSVTIRYKSSLIVFQSFD